MSVLALGSYIMGIASKRDQMTALLGYQFHHAHSNGSQTTACLCTSCVE